MSFLERAKQAASQAADQAKSAAEGAKAAAEQARQTMSENSERAAAAMNDPATAEKARQAVSRAKRGFVTAIDRIDPRVLADVIIKATALQERANAALKAKGSPYRISEISIGAAIPPSVTFAIGRSDDPAADEVPAGAIASTTLAADVAASEPGAVRALDGTTFEESLVIEDA